MSGVHIEEEPESFKSLYTVTGLCPFLGEWSTKKRQGTKIRKKRKKNADNKSIMQ